MDITVGPVDSAVIFKLPKELLCKSSTYFDAALNNGFLETTTQKLTLDDHSEVFRTYAAWLFQLEITDENLMELLDPIRHLFQVYIFADKRGIRTLANDVVTYLSSFWVQEPIDVRITVEFLPLIPLGCTLYRLVLDNLVLESRADWWHGEEWKKICNHSKEIIVELYKREHDFPYSF